MFKRKKCPKCENKISEKDKFCSYCGFKINGKTEKKEDWGLLGKEDSSENLFENSFLEKGFTGNMLNKILGNTMKVLEKEMRKIQENPPRPNTKFELFINGKRIDPKNIQVTSKKIERKNKEIQKIELPSRIFKNFSKLPQENPKTSVRRLADKIIYELEIPGVKSIEDISISKIGNSIEIKAISKEKAYFKSINISLPITKYNLEEEKLILELEAN
jgi:hypothetical protein